MSERSLLSHLQEERRGPTTTVILSSVSTFGRPLTHWQRTGMVTGGDPFGQRADQIDNHLDIDRPFRGGRSSGRQHLAT